jgi:ABC-type sulfate transport system permease subunit
MPADDDQPLREARTRVARQRELIALMEANGSDATEAKSLLGDLQYNLRLRKQRPRPIRWHRRAG